MHLHKLVCLFKACSPFSVLFFQIPSIPMTEEYKGAIGIITKNILKKSVEILGKKDSDPTPNPLVKLEEYVKKLSCKDPQLMVEPDDSFQVINCLKDLTSVLVELSLRSSKSEKHSIFTKGGSRIW